MVFVQILHKCIHIIWGGTNNFFFISMCNVRMTMFIHSKLPIFKDTSNIFRRKGKELVSTE